MANWLCERTIMLFGSALYRCCLRNWQPHTVMFLLIVSRTLCPITVVQGHNKQLACIRSTYSLNMHLPACGLPRGVLMLANEGTPQSPNVPHPTPPCSHSGRRDGCNQSEPPLPHQSIPLMYGEWRLMLLWMGIRLLFYETLELWQRYLPSSTSSRAWLMSNLVTYHHLLHGLWLWLVR